MRLRLPLLLGAIAAAAIAVSPAQAASSAGCSSTKPAAAGKSKPSFKKPATVLAKGKRYAIVMNTTCGHDPHRPRPQARRPDPELDRVPGARSASSTVSRSTAWSPDFILQGGDPEGDGTGGPGYEVVGALPSSYRYKLGDIAMAKTATAPSGAAGSQFFVISGPQRPQLPPDYGLLGHAADKASLATIKRIAALATSSAATALPRPRRSGS